MRSIAVVLTYPGHFLQTQLTLRSLRLHLPEVQNITVLVDDISPWAWPNYVDHCGRAYSQVNVQPLSQYEFLQDIKPGWLRQQMAKLHLDQIVTDHEVFVADGDIVFRTSVPYRTTPVNLVSADQPDSTADLQQQYVRQLLGPQIVFDLYHGRRPDFSAVGFRDVDLKLLSDIRSLAEKNTGQSFLDYHNNLSPDRVYGTSEWELIEHYRLSILNQPPNYTLFGCHTLNTEIIQLQTHWFSTNWLTDKEFGLAWWLNQDLQGLESVWNLLPCGPLPIGK